MQTSSIANSPLRQKGCEGARDRTAVRGTDSGVGSASRVQDAEAMISLILLVTIVVMLILQSLA
jgi:hypothetical protein